MTWAVFHNFESNPTLFRRGPDTALAATTTEAAQAWLDVCYEDNHHPTRLLVCNIEMLNENRSGFHGELFELKVVVESHPVARV